jgi:endogenous inhibitor of DNA gyrase (YacG/DUF329 family)
MSASSPTSRPARRIVTCPTCGGDSVYAPENAYRPFCSERCKNVDFGAWASESYRVPARPPLSTDGPDGDMDGIPPKDDQAS